MNDFLEAAHVHNSHGLRGDLKIEHFCDDLAALSALPRLYVKRGGDFVAYPLTKAVPLGHLTLIHLKGIDDLNSAITLKNTILYASRNDFTLPEGRTFISDLIGLPALDADSGKKYGIVRDYTIGAASGLWEIETPDGKTVLLPDVEAFIISSDSESGIRIRPISGFFDDEI